VFVSIETGDHSQQWLDRFAAEVGAMPEVMEFYRMAGDVDYMLRVVVPDIAGYDSFYKRLIAAGPLKDVNSRFAMEEVKATTALPLACGGHSSARTPWTAPVVAVGRRKGQPENGWKGQRGSTHLPLLLEADRALFRGWKEYLMTRFHPRML